MASAWEINASEKKEDGRKKEKEKENKRRRARGLYGRLLNQPQAPTYRLGSISSSHLFHSAAQRGNVALPVAFRYEFSDMAKEHRLSLADSLLFVNKVSIQPPPLHEDLPPLDVGRGATHFGLPSDLPPRG